MAKSVIHLSNLVKNKNPHRLANSEYYLVYVADREGGLFPALFTQYEITQAMKRAVKNPEDAPKWEPNWIQRLLNKLFSFCR